MYHPDDSKQSDPEILYLYNAHPELWTQEEKDVEIRRLLELHPEICRICYRGDCSH